MPGATCGTGSNSAEMRANAAYGSRAISAVPAIPFRIFGAQHDHAGLRVRQLRAIARIGEEAERIGRAVGERRHAAHDALRVARDIQPETRASSAAVYAGAPMVSFPDSRGQN